MTPQEVLALELDPNSSGETTVRGYLIELLKAVWMEGESFNGKRPFGDSSWEWDLFPPLIKAGLIKGTFDEDGYIEDVDDLTGQSIILEAIEALGRLQPRPGFSEYYLAYQSLADTVLSS